MSNPYGTAGKYRAFQVTFGDGFRVRVHGRDEQGAKGRAVEMWAEHKMRLRAEAPEATVVAL